ncbi:MAG: hypothetical protein QNJ30_04030 [Kiloniellales bacterium]|nr:hypothetical protein [Kiloniellales bacterium]
MRKFRDRAIDRYDLLARGHFKAPRDQELQNDLASLSAAQRDIVRNCVIDCVDGGLHDFLFALQETADFENEVRVMVDGKNVAEISDGLQGELFSEDGWFARFSAYGEPAD